MIYLKQARTPVAFALGCSEDNVIQYAEEKAYCVVRIPPQRGREPHHGIIVQTVQSTTFDTLCAGLSIETFRHLQDDMLLAGHSSIVFGARVQSVSFRTRAFVRLRVSSPSLHWLGRRQLSVGVDGITGLEESAAAAAIITVVTPRARV
jgi:hypothetical protein